MSEITQGDRDAAADFALDCGMMAYWQAEKVRKGECDDFALVKAFAAHRQIELTDAMIEAGAKEHYNRSHLQELRKATVTAIFKAMMGARS